MSTSEIKSAIPPALVILGDEAELQTAGVANESWAASGDAGFSAAGFGAGDSIGAAAVRGSDSMGLISDFEDQNEPFDQSQLDTVAEIEPINSRTDELSTDDSEEEAMELEEMDLVSGEMPQTDEDSDLGEFQIPDQTAKAEDSPSVTPVMMDIEATRRRRKGGPGWKSIVGVALGGLLSLPIVGGILHVLGKPVPVIGPILNEYVPMGNQSVVKRASAPMSIDPPVLLDDQPVQGRSLADELSPAELNPGGVAPADAALAEITGDSQPAQPNSFEPSSEVNSADTSSGPMNDPAVGTNDPSDVGFAFPDPGASPDLDNQPANDASMPAVEEVDGGSSEPSSDPSLAKDLFGGSETTSRPTPEVAIEPMPADKSMPADKPMPTVVEPAAPTLNLDNEINRLEQSLAQISSMPSDDAARGEAVDQLYADLSTMAGQADVDSIKKATPLLTKLASDMSLVKAFALAAPGWIDQNDQQRETNGAVVVGKLSGEPGNASILLSNKQAVPVTLPTGATEVPGGIQVGLGKIEGTGDAKTISLELLQGL